MAEGRIDGGFQPLAKHTSTYYFATVAFVAPVEIPADSAAQALFHGY